MKIRDLSIHLEQHGEGDPTLIFLHYWGGTSRTWNRVAARLQGKFRTVVYDARGWEKSDKRPAGYALNDLADEALALVREVGVNEFVLVGHSLGGGGAKLRNSLHPAGLRGLSAWCWSLQLRPPLCGFQRKCGKPRYTHMTIARTCSRPSVF